MAVPKVSAGSGRKLGIAVGEGITVLLYRCPGLLVPSGVRRAGRGRLRDTATGHSVDLIGIPPLGQRERDSHCGCNCRYSHLPSAPLARIGWQLDGLAKHPVFRGFLRRVRQGL